MLAWCLCRYHAGTRYSWLFKDPSVHPRLQVCLHQDIVGGLCPPDVLNPCPCPTCLAVAPRRVLRTQACSKLSAGCPHFLLILARQETKPSVKAFCFANDMMGLFPSLLSHRIRSPCQLTQETKTPQVGPSTLPGNTGVVTSLLDPSLLSPSLIKSRCCAEGSHLVASPGGEASRRGGT